MSTYLFAWNSAKFDWENAKPSLDEQVEACRKQCGLFGNWSSGVTKRIQRGDRFFLMKLGREQPSGIMGSGFTLGSPQELAHWSDESDKTALYVDLHFDTLLHPKKEEILARSLLEEQIPSVYWTPQSSGMTIEADDAAHLEFLWSEHLSRIGLSPLSVSDEISTPERYPEGAVTRVTVNAYERNPRARAACIEKHGYSCKVCDFDLKLFTG